MLLLLSSLQLGPSVDPCVLAVVALALVAGRAPPDSPSLFAPQGPRAKANAVTVNALLMYTSPRCIVQDEPALHKEKCRHARHIVGPRGARSSLSVRSLRKLRELGARHATPWHSDTTIDSAQGFH
jgi:hypothetical protein